MTRLLAILVVLAVAIGGQPLLLAATGPCGCHAATPLPTRAPDHLLAQQPLPDALSPASRPAHADSCCAGCTTTASRSSSPLQSVTAPSKTNQRPTNDDHPQDHRPCTDCDCPLPCCGVAKAPVATVDPTPGRMVAHTTEAPPASEQRLSLHAHLDDLSRPPRHPAPL